ncbi:DEAD-box ATP-dependent RNA helicase 13 [Glycine soja]|nr:DEAD-box ATP-dependent RNA helicase 13 [Glycine soja]
MSIVCVYFVSPFIGHGTQILEIAMDRFRENENGILVATDVAARGLDILGVRTIVHYRLPHSAEVCNALFL